MFNKLFYKKREAKIINVEKISSNLLKIDFKTDFFEYIPGQYIILYIEGVVARNYSIYEVSLNKTVFSIIVNINGDGIGRRSIKEFNINKEIFFAGPMGDFIYNNNEVTHKNWFIATGSGISPFIPMIKNIKDKKDIILFLGARDKNEFPQINIEGINIIYSITNKDTLWNGERGRINRVMIEYLENEKEKEDISFYICGAPHMVMDTKKLLEACNINKDKIYYEKFGF